MYYKINNHSRVVSEYHNQRLVQSIHCESLVIVLDDKKYKIYNHGNNKKLCGVSTCHAFLSGDILFKDVSLVGTHDRIIYDVKSSRFVCESGQLLKQGDAVIIYPLDKRCYVVRGQS